MFNGSHWLTKLHEEIENKRKDLWTDYSFTEEYCQANCFEIVDMYPTFEYIQERNVLATVMEAQKMPTAAGELFIRLRVQRFFHPEDPSMKYWGLLVRSPNNVIKPFSIELNFINGAIKGTSWCSLLPAENYKGLERAIFLYSLDKNIQTKICMYGNNLNVFVST